MQHVSFFSIHVRINVYPSWTASWTEHLPDGSTKVTPSEFPWRVDGCFELTTKWVGARRVWSEKRISNLSGLARYFKKLLDLGYLKDGEHASKCLRKLADDLDSLNCEGLYQLSAKKSAFDTEKRLGMSYNSLLLFEMGLRAAVLQKYPSWGYTAEDLSQNQPKVGPTIAKVAIDAARRSVW